MLDALDSTIAQIANSVTRLTETQDKITQGYIDLQEAMVTMAKSNDETRQMMKDFTTSARPTDLTGEQEDMDMENLIAGKRGATDITSTAGRFGTTAQQGDQLHRAKALHSQHRHLVNPISQGLLPPAIRSQQMPSTALWTTHKMEVRFRGLG